MKNYKKNKILLEKTFNYKPDMEHDACGVGLIATTDGKKSRKVVEYGIEALKAIWHRGAVDADGKSGDGAQGYKLKLLRIFLKKKFWQLVIPLMMRKEFALVWFSCHEQIIQSKKNVEK